MSHAEFTKCVGDPFIQVEELTASYKWDNIATKSSYTIMLNYVYLLFDSVPLLKIQERISGKVS